MINETVVMTEEISTVPPGPADVGLSGTWELQVSDGSSVRIQGVFLGMSSSQRATHENHTGAPYGVSGSWTSWNERCSACRWFEPRIFLVDEQPRFFMLYKIGATIVPGEDVRRSCVRAGSAFELIESMAIRREGRLILPTPSRRVIAQAAGYDAEIRSAWMDWRSSS